MMAAAGCDGHRAFGHFLAFDVGVVDGVSTELLDGRVPGEFGRRDRQLIGEKSHRFGERVDGDDFDVLNDRRFLGIRHRHQQTSPALLLRRDRHREHPLDRPDGIRPRPTRRRRSSRGISRIRVANSP